MSRARVATIFVLAVAALPAATAHAQTPSLQLGVSATGPCPPCSYAGGAGVTAGRAVYLRARSPLPLPRKARLRLVRVRIDPTSRRRVLGSTRTTFCAVGARLCHFRRVANTATILDYQASVVTSTKVLARSRIVRVAWTSQGAGAVLPRLVGMTRGTSGPSWTVAASADFSNGSATFGGESVSWTMPLTIDRGAPGRVDVRLAGGTGTAAVTFTSPPEFGPHIDGKLTPVHQTVARGGAGTSSTQITFDPQRTFTPGERFEIGLETGGPEIRLQFVAK